MSRRAEGFSNPLDFSLRRNAHAETLNQKQVNRDEHDDYSGENGDMKSEKPGQRGSGHLVATAQKDHHGLANDGNLASDLSPNLGGEEG